MIPDIVIEKYLANSPNLLIPWYLMASYGYYHLHKSIMSDGMYDDICKRLFDAYSAFEIDHIHMHLCDLDALEAGTAFHIKKENYPLMVVGSLEKLMKDYRI